MRFLTLLVFICIIARAAFAQAETLVVNGVSRQYEFDPAPGSGPRPLIIALHGGGGSAAEFKRDSGLTAMALLRGVSVVYPESITRQWNDGRSHGLNHKVDQADDVGFLQALVKDLVARGLADPARVVFTGVSNGGMMSFAMACKADLPIYAIAPVSANVGAGQDCSNAKVRLLNIVGTVDRVVPMAGGPVLFGWGQGEVMSAQDSYAMFLKANGCTGTASHTWPTSADDGMTAVITQGQSCHQAPVAQVVVKGSGHGWPGGAPVRSRLLLRVLGPVAQGISASQLVVDLTLGKSQF